MTERVNSTAVVGDPARRKNKNNENRNVKGNVRDQEKPGGNSKNRTQRRRISPVLLSLLSHVLCVALYIRPLSRTHPNNPNLVSGPRPVLDESHIMTDENKDVRGTAPLEEVWRNDYWGRPMNSPSSHKSWRPLTVLSFRWLKLEWLSKLLDWDELFVHRLVNVLIHATAAELVGIISAKVFPSMGETKSLTMRFLTKMLFALHPTHVECTANAANRPHILAVMVMCIACDPNVHLLLCMCAVAAGLLSSETAIFQIPAVLVTMTVIKWRQGEPQSTLSSMIKAGISLIPRYFIVISVGLTYFIGRHMFDTLSIPDGLIRPAENPYYALTGIERALTYTLVLSSHIGKAFLVDPVGFSHEYGFDCVRKVVSFAPLDDMRLFIPIGLVMGSVVITCECIMAGLQVFTNWLLMLAWLATLFPVSGFIKVGTSIADRISVPSTFAVSLVGGRALAGFILEFGSGLTGPSSSVGSDRKSSWISIRAWTVLKTVVVLLGLSSMWIKVDRRASEWMDSVTLLESSLSSCPRSAKSNLEISKIYSGLYPEKHDLKKALSYLKIVEEIDPDYCDVHQQFAHCHIQEGKYLEFEERLTKALMCPFSMGGSLPLWQQYWKLVTADPVSGADAAKRMAKYQKIIEKAVQEESEKEEKAEREKNKRDEL